MAIQRWDPFGHRGRMGEATARAWPLHLLPLSALYGLRHGGRLVPTDAFFTDDAFVVRVVIPGFRAEDVDLTVVDGALVLKGEVKEKEEGEKSGMTARWGLFGSFHRSVALPKGLDAHKAEAAFQDGILTVTIPKAPEAKAQKIQIKA